MSTRCYYYAGNRRIAIRVENDQEPANNGLFFLLGDDLGSTSVMADANGNKVSEMGYKPWGKSRYAAGSAVTDYRFTGQWFENAINLYWYNARWYDPYMTNGWATFDGASLNKADRTVTRQYY